MFMDNFDAGMGMDNFSMIQQKKITVYRNGDFSKEGGQPLYVDTGWDIDQLLNAASQRLDLVPSAQRVFNSDGVELDDVMMVEDKEMLFFSMGADFQAPAPPTPRLQSPGPAPGISPSQDAEWEKNKRRDSLASNMPGVIGGYKVGNFLGRGGFGEVRVGTHQVSLEQVALKFLEKNAIANMGAAERTTTEIQCLTALRHPNIIRLLQQLESPHHVVLVFELMGGGDLFQYLKDLPMGPDQAQRLGEEDARGVFHQVISAVGYAHNHHICHRDLKLDNILLIDDDSGSAILSHIKVADFGLSEFYRPGEVQNSQCGTLSYLAPEVFRGTSNAGPPLDVWSLGVILFAMLCGRLPFEGSNLSGANRPREAVIRNRICKCQYKMDEHLSPDAKDLVRRMLKLDPSERVSIPEVFNHSWLRSRGPNSQLIPNSPAITASSV
eukprot:CAMPEP_0119500978 /NCGR_PEP_ID=MMETSP1344-20130328/22950_1 /TAXON_ID=236787 /ORGANISM="Florenciella parvula, Strain CCMP2471" /LENGTH=437 /DNA_ID=CAMNT_0007537103 /DNA_START=336 /DNA_END=1646 /DNA_ORIENTATION=-